MMIQYYALPVEQEVMRHVETLLQGYYKANMNLYQDALTGDRTKFCTQAPAVRSFLTPLCWRVRCVVRRLRAALNTS